MGSECRKQPGRERLLAGGKIMVHSGIIEKLKLSDDELAQIMAMKGAARAYPRKDVRSLYALSLLSAATGGRYDGYLDMMAKSGCHLCLFHAGREHEIEADMMGLELAARAGYNPHAAISLWQKMAQAGGSQPPQFLSTHPSCAARGSANCRRIPAMPFL